MGFIIIFLMILPPKIGLGIFIASIFFNVVFYLIYKAKLGMELTMLPYFVQTIGISVKVSKLSFIEDKFRPLINPLELVLKYGFFSE